MEERTAQLREIPDKCKSALEIKAGCTKEPQAWTDNVAQEQDKLQCTKRQFAGAKGEVRLLTSKHEQIQSYAINGKAIEKTPKDSLDALVRSERSLIERMLPEEDLTHMLQHIVEEVGMSPEDEVDRLKRR